MPTREGDEGGGGGAPPGGGGATTLRAWGPAVAWAAGILVVTSLPLAGTVPVASVPAADKLVHGVMYGGLGWTLGRALRLTGRSARRSMAVALVGGALFAALDEVHQHWIITRVPEFVDWVADAVGLVIGVVLFRVVRLRRPGGPGADEGPRGAGPGRGQASGGAQDERGEC